MQRTLASDAEFIGVGLHTGKPVRMVLKPAPANHGIVFRRVDLPGKARDIPARWDRVIVSALNTRIESAPGVTVSTIEHIMAALAGLGIHNTLIEIDGPEVPILDGSAAPFLRGLLGARIRSQAARLFAIKILAPVAVGDMSAGARFTPSKTMEIDFSIDFPDPVIGRQRLCLNMGNGAFLRELADSRTFCRACDVAAMQADGKALGGTYENAVVVDGERVLTPGGLRHKDEAVRHKMLDAMGDLYTAGAPIIGRYTGNKAGHAVTNRLLRALMDRPDCWRRIEVTPHIARHLPGAGVGAADLDFVA